MRRNTVAVVVVVLALAAMSGCGMDSDDQPAYAPPPAYNQRPDSGAAYSADAGVWQEPTIPEEDYGKWVENDFVQTQQEPLSTFSIDVDTASYSYARGQLNNGALPEPNSVRVEEFINYFSFEYPQPTDAPFSINMEAAPSKFGPGYTMLRIGLQGLTLPEAERKPANLIFLIDISGSMNDYNKLPLVKSALGTLLDHLGEQDTLGIVTYSSNVVELMQPTSVTDKSKILGVISGLYASGSTAGGPGIQTAYDMAKRAFISGGINRVILCTDGDFNLGLTGSALVDYVVARRDEGVTLSVLGFGMGNYQDSFLEELSNKGNGNYAYIDSQQEAEKVFGQDLLGTLQVIAKDVKVQVEFDAAAVEKYRLLGYENRLLKPEDFTDDKKDAGEIGSGHRVTAFYEMSVLQGLDPAAVLATVRFRYKEPDGDVSKELIRVIRAQELQASFAQASADFRFAAAVAELAEILRHSKHSEGAQFSEVKSIAAATAGSDSKRQELVQLVDLAQGLWPSQP